LREESLPVEIRGLLYSLETDLDRIYERILEFEGNERVVTLNVTKNNVMNIRAKITIGNLKIKNVMSVVALVILVLCVKENKFSDKVL
jgi:hypothetical protein